MDRLSRQGDREAIRFRAAWPPVGDKERHKYDSFVLGPQDCRGSPLRGTTARGETVSKENVCAAFSGGRQRFVDRRGAVRAALDTGCDTIVVGGGSANSRLRALLRRSEPRLRGVTVRMPPAAILDNGSSDAAIGSSAGGGRRRTGISPDRS